jgi:hypothetical protein
VDGKLRAGEEDGSFREMTIFMNADRPDGIDAGAPLPPGSSGLSPFGATEDMQMDRDTDYGIRITGGDAPQAFVSIVDYVSFDPGTDNSAEDAFEGTVPDLNGTPVAGDAYGGRYAYRDTSDLASVDETGFEFAVPYGSLATGPEDAVQFFAFYGDVEATQLPNGANIAATLIPDDEASATYGNSTDWTAVPGPQYTALLGDGEGGNNPPTANDDSYSTEEAQPLTVPPPGVLANDTDPDGDSLSATLDSSVTNGSLTLNTDGSFEYIPDSSFTGTDSFVYEVSDDSGATDNATVTITVEPATSPPQAQPDSYQAVAGRTLTVPAPGVLGNDSEPEGNPLLAEVVSFPEDGLLLLSPDGSFAYGPSPGFAGTDQFSYQAVDPDGSADTTTVTIDVQPSAPGPAPGPTLVSTADYEDGQRDSSATGGTTLQPDSSVVSPTSNGLTSLRIDATAGGTATLERPANLPRSDRLRFLLKPSPDTSFALSLTFVETDDGSEETHEVSVPVDTGDTWQRVEVPFSDLGPGFDPVAPRAGGNGGFLRLELSADEAVTYHVDEFEFGTESRGHTELMDFERTSLAYGPSFCPPTFEDSSDVAVESDGFTARHVMGSGCFGYNYGSGPNRPGLFVDAEGSDVLSLRLKSDVGGTLRAFVETPFGTGGFTTENAVTVPLPTSNSWTRVEIPIDSLGDDPSALRSPGIWNVGFVASGPDGGEADFLIDDVKVVGAGANRPPVAQPDSFATPLGQPLIVNAPGVLANDVDPNQDPFSALLVSDVSNGSLTLDANGAVEYTPDSEFTGTDQFTYRAVDDSSAADTTTATIEVLPEEECPLAWSLGVTGTDASGDSVSVTFGQSGAATAGIDPDCGEEEQPPKPPSEVFDLRFTGTDLPGVEIGEGLARDIRPTDQPTPEAAESAPAIWRMEVQSNSYPVTFNWDNAALADSLPGKPVRLVDVVTGGDLVDIDMKSTGSYTLDNSSVTALEIRLDREITREVPIAAGWNLLSVPLQAEDPSFGAVLPLCESGFFFEAGSGYNGIAEGDPVPVGRGLFANCSAGTAEVTGQAPAPTIEVAEGWNIIGPLADSIDVGSITSDPAGIVQSSFFGFDPAGGYQNASTLGPGGGYWVKAGESGTLDLSGNSGGASALASTQSASTAQKQPGAELRLTDAARREATLRLTEDLTEAQRKRSALPPVPPSGVFDVRFEGGRSVAEATGDVRAIETQGLEAPVTVRLANAEAGQGVRIRHGGSETRLTAERPSAELSTTDGLAVQLQAAPDAFALEKTYPNPASGRATVEYALPEQAEVTIAVYDVLGRRVATLADGDEQAGRHAAVLDAGQMPSGTYFVRMRAGDFQQTRRLTIVR